MKKIIAVTVSVLMCMILFTACKEDTTEMDRAINEHLVGAWSVKGSTNNYINEAGELNVEIYFFTGTEIMYALGTPTSMQTSKLMDYKISGGKLMVTDEGRIQYAKLEFLDGTMNWITDNAVIEYVKIPAEALADYPLTYTINPEFTQETDGNTATSENTVSTGDLTTEITSVS